ncbi:MAG: DUF883 family protein [Pseudomonadota bacterium]
MQDTNIPTRSINGSAAAVGADFKTLVHDAQALLQEASAMTGEKADEIRQRGMALLDQALDRAGQAQGKMLVRGKELAHNTDVYVKENPWRSIATAAGIGLLFGVILGRR